MATITYPERVAPSRDATRGPVALVGALPERRDLHRFAPDGLPNDPPVASNTCLLCGYAEAGHPALTGPERHVVIGLLNQVQPPPLMRRSILRKLRDI